MLKFTVKKCDVFTDRRPGWCRVGPHRNTGEKNQDWRSCWEELMDRLWHTSGPPLPPSEALSELKIHLRNNMQTCLVKCLSHDAQRGLDPTMKNKCLIRLPSLILISTLWFFYLKEWNWRNKHQLNHEVPLYTTHHFPNDSLISSVPKNTDYQKESVLESSQRTGWKLPPWCLFCGAEGSFL